MSQLAAAAVEVMVFVVAVVIVAVGVGLLDRFVGMVLEYMMGLLGMMFEIFAAAAFEVVADVVEP
jgi:uncharacterized membrane protein required for colicin V production